MVASSAFMLSMQAAGAIGSLFSASQQNKLMELGREVDNAQMEANLSLVREQSSENSLSEMKKLRQNIGSQIAIQAARGTASGSGSAKSLQQDSFATFAEDERTRRLNLLSKEAQLRSSNALSGLHTLTSETQLGQSITKSIFNTFDTRGLSDTLFSKKKG